MTEERPIIEAVRGLRRDLRVWPTSAPCSPPRSTIGSGRSRRGSAGAHPPPSGPGRGGGHQLEAKNRFRQLYQEEEVRILEDTNRIFEIERYLERNPRPGQRDLTRQIETFRRQRLRYDTGRKEDNVKRDDLLELRRAMNAASSTLSSRPPGGRSTASASRARPTRAASRRRRPAASRGTRLPRGSPTKASRRQPEIAGEAAPLDRGPAPDPLLNEVLHKIMFALELVIWDHRRSRRARQRDPPPPPRALGGRTATGAGERGGGDGTLDWELEACSSSSAPRCGCEMDEEVEEISRLSRANERRPSVRPARALGAEPRAGPRVSTAGSSGSSTTCCTAGDTDRLEQVYRSRFRFVNVFSRLWFDHQASGGITPL